MVWEVKKLGDVGNIFSGNSINAKLKKEKYLNLEEGIPYVATKDVSYDSKIDYDNGVRIPEGELDKFRVAHKNSIFICAEGGSAGRKLAFNTKDVCFVNKLFALEAFDFMDPKFVYYFYQTSDFQKQFKSRMTGLIGGVSKGKFKNINIPVPPLPIQQKIVNILDEAFEKLSKAKENAETNLNNSKEVFESYLQSVFENKGEDWEEKRLGDIAEVEYGFTGKAKDEGEYRYVRITDTSENGLLIPHNKLYLKKSSEAEKFIIENHDLLMARTGASFAKVLFFEETEKSVFASYLIRINFKIEMINKLYWYFTKSKIYWDQANKLASGSAQPHFNGAAVKKVVFSYPKSLEQQKQIVSKLDNLSAETKKLERIYDEKLTDLEELKKSILQKAFKGELTKGN